jgi:hypothetical protein
MQGLSTRSGWCRATAWLVVATACVAFIVGVTAARAAPSATSGPYSITVSVLTGPQGGTLTIALAAASNAPAIDQLAKVHVWTSRDQAEDNSLMFKDVPVHDGIATVELGPLDRGSLVDVQVHVRPGTPALTYVLRGETTALLRPDLAVTAVHAPLQTLTTRPIDVQAEIDELNGDTGGTATVTLLWGPSVLGTTSVTVPAGSHVSVSFSAVALTSPMPVELSVLVSDVSPAETDGTNDARSVSVDVTENELASSRLVLGSLGGYGVQMNGHVYAGVLPAPPASIPDLEAKVKALEPQLVRIFYSEAQEAIPERLASFIETVQLAQESGATINITYQSADRAKLNPVKFMGDFAAVLDDLVRVRGLTNVRWVTVQNEPNSTRVTLAQYEALYRALDARLVALGLRGQIKLMGGDLVETGDGNVPNPDQHTWWDYMSQHMNDVLDAYSVHIYWNYWDIPRMEFRLKDVRQIVMEELPAEARKPIYVTEFGVRGIVKLADGTTIPQPGNWEDGTPLARTNIAAFQQLWFCLAAAQLGYAGVVKWDAYWGKYDSSYKAAHYLIGPPEEGWPLFPAYHALRLLLQTTERGWQVLGVDPWTDDDWKLSAEGAADDQPEKELVAYRGPAGELTLIGLDSHGRALNAASAEAPSYSVGGLPPHTTFNLAVWNGDGTGENSIAATVTTNAAGVARFTVPLQGAFALTTVPVG